MTRLLKAAAISLCLVATVAFAGSGFQAKPFSFDPDKTGDITAAWTPHIGLPDAGGSDHGLLLQKNGPTTDNAAAGASIAGVSGIVLTEIGYDFKNGGHCGAGAPRFNVQASDGFHKLNADRGRPIRLDRGPMQSLGAVRHRPIGFGACSWVIQTMAGEYAGVGPRTAPEAFRMKAMDKLYQNGYNDL